MPSRSVFEQKGTETGLKSEEAERESGTEAIPKTLRSSGLREIRGGITEALEKEESPSEKIARLEEENKTLREALEKSRINEKRLEKLTVRDALTGVFNKTYFKQKIEEEMSKLDRAREKNEEKYLSLIFLDMDHFKEVNDTLGHLVGDHAIIEFANILKKNTRDYDTISRIGGEEFVIIMDSNEENTTKKAESIRKQIEEEMKETIKKTVKRLHRQKKMGKRSLEEDLKLVNELAGTASLGVSSHSTHKKNEMDAEELKETADQAMYHSKKTGRNRVTRYAYISDEKAS